MRIHHHLQRRIFQDLGEKPLEDRDRLRRSEECFHLVVHSVCHVAFLPVSGGRRTDFTKNQRFCSDYTQIRIRCQIARLGEDLHRAAPACRSLSAGVYAQKMPIRRSDRWVDIAVLEGTPSVSPKKETRSHVSLFLEAPPGFEPGVKDLQSHALPLGYGAKKMERATRFELATSTLARWRSAK